MTDSMWADEDFEDHVLTDVREHPDGYDLRFDGMGFFLRRQYDDDPPHGVVPKAGDTVRQWPGGLGYSIRGIAVNGAVAYYHTEAQERARQEREAVLQEAKQLADFEMTGRAKLDADYAALPPIFQRRIDKFRHNNPDFRWKYEGYEMFCCTEAVKIADALKTTDAVRAFAEAKYEEQKRLLPDVAFDQHSGNTFGCATRLAYLYLDQPEGVQQMHGALAPLVGSREYGCVPPDA